MIVKYKYKGKVFYTWASVGTNQPAKLKGIFEWRF